MFARYIERRNSYNHKKLWWLVLFGLPAFVVGFVGYTAAQAWWFH